MTIDERVRKMELFKRGLVSNPNSMDLTLN